MDKCKNIFISGSNLIFYMNQKGMTIEELSKGTGISMKTIQRYRSGERLPDIEKAYAISSFLQIKVDAIWCVFDRNLKKK